MAACISHSAGYILNGRLPAIRSFHPDVQLVYGRQEDAQREQHACQHRTPVAVEDYDEGDVRIRQYII